MAMLASIGDIRKLWLILCLWVIVAQNVAQAQYWQSPQNYPAQPQQGQYYDQSPQPQQYFCTIQSEEYDCLFRDVVVNYNAMIPTFGQNAQNKKRVSFVDSRMDYLPKSLMDAFSNMKILNANYLQIRSLQPQAFQHSSKLLKMFLSGNFIEQISLYTFQGATSLVTIVLDQNRINSIDQSSFSDMQNLKSFYISFNKIPSLPFFSNNNLLEIVNASHNSLTQIDDNHFSQNPKLRYLDLSFNSLSFFNTWQLNFKYGLQTVDISSNHLPQLYIPTHVKYLNARNNSIERLFTHERDCLVLNLNLAKNKLTEQPDLAMCRRLQNLDLSHNLMESFNFAALQSMFYLSHLNLQNNRLFQIELPVQFQNPLSIKYLDLSSNMLSSVPNTNALNRLLELYLHRNTLENFDFLNKPNLIRLTVAFNQWDCNAISALDNLDVLDREEEECRGRFKDRGICCQSKSKQDAQSFQTIKDLMREIFNLELQNTKSVDCKCGQQIRDQQQNSNQINSRIATISNLEASKEPILQEISQVKEKLNRLNDQIVASQNDSQTKNNQISQLAKEIDRWRAVYNIEKEGLVDAREVLQRVVQFLDSRNENSADLLTRRQQEVRAGREKGQIQQNLVETAKTDLETMKQSQKDLKQKEQTLKTERNALLAQINKNSASVKGS